MSGFDKAKDHGYPHELWRLTASITLFPARSPASRSLATALPEAALARGLLPPGGCFSDPTTRALCGFYDFTLLPPEGRFNPLCLHRTVQPSIRRHAACVGR